MEFRRVLFRSGVGPERQGRVAPAPGSDYVEERRPSAIAHQVSNAARIAGSVTAGKSRASATGPQMPTATSQNWKSACAHSQSAEVAQSKTRYCPRARTEERRVGKEGVRQ